MDFCDFGQDLSHEDEKARQQRLFKPFFPLLFWVLVSDFEVLGWLALFGYG